MEESKPSLEDLMSMMIMQEMRNYDVLMHILMHFDEEVGIKLSEIHKDLDTCCPPPFFLSDQVEE